MSSPVPESSPSTSRAAQVRRALPRPLIGVLGLVMLATERSTFLAVVMVLFVVMAALDGRRWWHHVRTGERMRPVGPAPIGPLEAGTSSVVLVEAGQKHINVVKVVREATGADLLTAKRLVGEVPSTVVSDVSAATAERVRQALEAAGARVEVRDRAAPST